jgi:CubicO group peptidase (beta-lactamase class C family)
MKTPRLTIVLLFFAFHLAAQNLPLLRSTPEKEGVSSEALTQFIDAANNVQKNGIEFHSFMVVRHGKVIAEGWWNPYGPTLKHTMYSVSKSFTATAIGFCVAEKRLTVEDKVISFFPNDLPDTVSENLKALRIRDLLTMSVGHEREYTGEVIRSDNWIKSFLAKPIKYQPGTKFLYNTAATYILSAIVQKLTGQKVIDYLQPRLFKPLGINGIDWEIDPKGINTGGYGLRLKTEDMAKFGVTFLNHGKFNGKQVIPAWWVDSASTKKIDQEPDATQARRDTNDWVQGYAYQMWRSRHSSYRGDGAFGQYILVWPEQDAVIITTAEVGNMQAEFNVIWDNLLPAFKDKPLPENAKALAQLKAKEAALKLPVPAPGTSPLPQQLAGKTFRFDVNDKLLKSLAFNFNNNNITVQFVYDTAIYNINFAAGKWALDNTTRYGPYLLTGVKNNRVGQLPFKIAGAYSWKDEKTLELTLRYIESPHTETIVCKFDGDSIQVDFINIANAAQQRTIYNGKE